MAASKDPIGANLDRVQIIKAWVDSHGESHERTHDVAASEDRMDRAGGNALASVGNTVDAAAASYGNAIGEAQLTAIGRDPSFDPTQEALYYARVIEVPTPRHSTCDAKRLGVEAPEPTVVHERAVTSAIWVWSRGQATRDRGPGR